MSPFKLNFIVLIVASVSCSQVSSQIFLGGRCSFGGYSNVKGECEKLTDCPSAISNFKAGINPSLCYQKDDVSVICCLKEKRISEKKCEEYARQIASVQANAPSFTPFIAGQEENAKPSGETGCKGVQFQTLIVGGRNAKPDELSFTVALGYDAGKGDEPFWFCGGTLISDQYILTASHCLDGKGKVSTPPNVVLLGDKSLKKLDDFASLHRQEVRVKDIIVHPEYERPYKYNDIGLIKLEKKVNFSTSLLPACLPQPNSRPERINEFLIAGWGQLEYFGKRGETLQVANIERVNQRECSETFGGIAGLPRGMLKSQICAGDKVEFKDSCGGDSGGPLVTNPDKSTCMQTIMGVVSFGDTFCGQGRPGVYTNVQSFLDWIESIVWEEELY